MTVTDLPIDDREGLSRRDHQATAKAAAREILPWSGEQRERVWVAVWRAGDDGMTRHELIDQLEISQSSCHPRVRELVLGGWIEADPTGRTRENKSSGRQAEVLVTTPKTERAIVPYLRAKGEL